MAGSEVHPLFCRCAKSKRGSAAAHLYCGGYLLTIASALFKFSDVKEKGVESDEDERCYY